MSGHSPTESTSTPSILLPQPSNKSHLTLSLDSGVEMAEQTQSAQHDPDQHLESGQRPPETDVDVQTQSSIPSAPVFAAEGLHEAEVAAQEKAENVVTGSAEEPAAPSNEEIAAFAKTLHNIILKTAKDSPKKEVLTDIWEESDDEDANEDANEDVNEDTEKNVERGKLSW